LLFQESGRLIIAFSPMAKACLALTPVALLTTRGLLSLIAGACALAQNSSPAETPNPSLFQLQHTAWTEREGAPPAINDISQAPDGSLWLGSGEGLYRFDGFTFERIRAIDRDSPAPMEVFALLATTDGDLWIGTSYNGAILLRNGVARRLPKFDGIPLNTTIFNFVKDLDGTLWAGTASGLQRLDGSQWRSVGESWGVPEMVRFWSLHLDSDGTLWTESPEHGLFRLKRGLRHFERLADLPQQDISFDQSPSGEYWAIANSGICPLAEVLNGTAGPHCVVRDHGSANPRFTLYPGVVFDRRGNLWTSSVRSEGIRRLDAAAFRDAFHPGHRETKVAAFTRRDGLTSDAVRAVFKDRRDGSIWVGTDHGLDHFREAPFLPALPLPSAGDFGVRAHDDGGAWVSSSGGGLWLSSPDGRAQKISVPWDNIESLYEARRGSLWIGMNLPMRIESLDHGKTTSLPLTPELEAQVGVQSIMEDGRGALWVSFVPYGLAKWESGRWIRNGGLTGLPEAWAVILNTGPDGKLWAGYLNGEAAVIDGISVRKFSVKDGLNIGPVAAILSGRSDCWLAGVNGLVRFDGRRFQVLSDAYRPFSGITGIAQAKNGDLWLNAWDGVRRIAAGELEQAEKNPAYAVHSNLYDLPDGLPSVPPRIRPFPTAVSTADGRIWFGLRSGVVSVDPEDPSLNPPAPPVSIVRAIADGKTFNAAANARLAARTKYLEIDYTAVSLNRASRVRFRYKLEGVDADWQNADSRRQAFYNNLPPGKYRFVVSASNGDNLWNEAGATLDINVPPAFFQTIWFRSLCVLATVLGLWGILRLRIRQTVAKVQEQFRERMLERERIAGELHDTLLQGYLSASLQAHAAFGRLAEDSAARQPLSRALELMGKASEESRIALRGIRSSQLGDLELGQALSRVPQELAASADVGFRVHVEGCPRPLRPVLLDDVYRIGREAIANALQHAGATNIEVEVEYGANQLRMLVQDNGCGIDAQLLQSGKAGHWGLKGIRERAERIGARLNLLSNPGAGTQVVLTIAGTLAFQPEDVGKRRGWVRSLFRPDSGLSEHAEREDGDERTGAHQNIER
jgi:signal transduction histidine kinase/ligand-binding sensor domain-containing protein